MNGNYRAVQDSVSRTIFRIVICGSRACLRIVAFKMHCLHLNQSYLVKSSVRKSHYFGKTIQPAVQNDVPDCHEHDECRHKILKDRNNNVSELCVGVLHVFVLLYEIVIEHNALEPDDPSGFEEILCCS